MSDIEPPARPIAKLPALAASGAPALVTALGERASYRFLEFFTANIRNPHTRRAYATGLPRVWLVLDAQLLHQSTQQRLERRRHSTCGDDRPAPAGDHRVALPLTLRILR
jgi:hypothetical protein